MIPPFISQIIGALVRALVVLIAGYLAGHAGISLNEDQIGSVVAYLAPILAVLAWSLYSKYIGRQKLLTALVTPGVMTEREVEARVSSPDNRTPSVLSPKNELPQ